MPSLPNGDVIPSFLSFGGENNPDFGDAFNNVFLRVGEIQSTIYPDEKASLTKKFIEYNVLVIHTANGTAVSKIYRAIVANLFGGGADLFTYTLRPSPDDSNFKPSATNQSTKGDFKPGKGSKVLILCINGQTVNAMIMGGIRDQNDEKDNKDLKHHLIFVFNGIEAFINNDGELTVRYNGKRQADSKLDDNVDKKVTGTYILFKENGNLEIATKDDEQQFKVNHKDKSIDIIAKDHWNVKVSGDIAIKADKKCTIKTSGVELGSADDFMLMGSTYRQNEQTLHNQLVAGLNTLSAQLTTAGAQFTSGSAVLAVPVIGCTLAAPFFAPASAANTTSIAGIQTMISGINAFESQANRYLSDKNKLDK